MKIPPNDRHPGEPEPLFDFIDDEGVRMTITVEGGTVIRGRPPTAEQRALLATMRPVPWKEKEQE